MQLRKTSELNQEQQLAKPVYEAEVFHEADPLTNLTRRDFKISFRGNVG